MPNFNLQSNRSFAQRIARIDAFVAHLPIWRGGGELPQATRDAIDALDADEYAREFASAGQGQQSLRSTSGAR